jgi:hypothetical protein
MAGVDRLCRHRLALYKDCPAPLGTAADGPAARHRRLPEIRGLA